MIEKLLLIPIRGEKVPNGHSAPAGTRDRLIIFTQLLFLHLLCRDWVRYVNIERGYQLILALFMTAAFILSLGGSKELRLFRGLLVLGRSSFNTARWIALAVISIKLVHAFPLCSNHLYIETFAVLFLTLTHLDKEEQQLAALAALRWLPVILLLWSGLQKVLYGTYFDGSFLALSSKYPNFAAFYNLVLPAEELRHLSQQTHLGPYGFHTVQGLVMANLTYLSEITVGILLLIPKTRPFAFCWACGLVFVIELGAREIFFGLLMFSLLLLFLDARWLAKWRWPAICIYAYILLSAFDIVPGGHTI